MSDRFDPPTPTAENDNESHKKLKTRMTDYILTLLTSVT